MTEIERLILSIHSFLILALSLSFLDIRFDLFDMQKELEKKKEEKDG